MNRFENVCVYLQTIQERGNRTTINLHHSMLDLDRTNIALENATNQLMALQHKQFVENRVYDDDETIANVDNVPTVDAEQTDEVHKLIEFCHTTVLIQFFFFVLFSFVILSTFNEIAKYHCH